jgi:hypothetical protein
LITIETPHRGNESSTNDDDHSNDQNQLFEHETMQHPEETIQQMEGLMRRASQRLRGAFNWSHDYVFFTKTFVPKYYFETIQHPRWIKSMQQEYNSIVKNYTWDLVKLLEAKITTKWVFKIKQAEVDQKEIFKARLVACGCEQRKRIDFEETFAPIIKW